MDIVFVIAAFIVVPYFARRWYEQSQFPRASRTVTRQSHPFNK